MSYNVEEISQIYTDDSADSEDFIQVPVELTMKEEKNNFDIIGLEKNSQYMKLLNDSREVTVNKDSFIALKGVNIFLTQKTRRITISSFKRSISKSLLQGESQTTT